MTSVHPVVHETPRGTPYLQAPGIVMISRPQVDISGIKAFLDGYDPGNGFSGYLDDEPVEDPGAQLIKFAGQVCYASFGERRTKNAEAQKYINNLLSSGHGSVLEHANYSLFLYGISRSLTHELVRHRAGCAFSQLSQRYVSGSVLRFVERPEYVEDKELHREFVSRIDQARADYEHIANALSEKDPDPSQSVTDRRKAVQQVARSVLPNETETTMVITANVRSWRHMIEMRGSVHAETEIRRLFFEIGLMFQKEEPLLFGDYKFFDGKGFVDTAYRKV